MIIGTFLTLGFGLIGFLDDYLKVVLKRSDGLLPWQKMALQIVVTAVFAFYLVNYSNVSLTMKIPFWSGHYLNLGWFAVPVLFFAVIGTVNGVNFTDGLDGLASSVTLIVAVFFTVVSLGMKSGVELSPAQLWAVLWDSFCLMYILPRYLWETPVLWHWGALWLVWLMPCRCRCLSSWSD